MTPGMSTQGARVPVETGGSGATGTGCAELASGAVAIGGGAVESADGSVFAPGAAAAVGPSGAAVAMLNVRLGAGSGAAVSSPTNSYGLSVDAAGGASGEGGGESDISVP